MAAQSLHTLEAAKPAAEHVAVRCADAGVLRGAASAHEHAAPGVNVVERSSIRGSVARVWVSHDAGRGRHGGEPDYIWFPSRHGAHAIQGRNQDSAGCVEPATG